MKNSEDISRPKNVALICRQALPLPKSSCKSVHWFPQYWKTFRYHTGLCSQSVTKIRMLGLAEEMKPISFTDVGKIGCGYCGFNHGFFILSLDLLSE